MQILSATEAVSPAIARTRLILFTPFRAGRTWKLAATSYLSSIGTLFMPIPLVGLFFVPLIVRESGKHWLVWAVPAGILFLTALFLFLFVLCSQLQFAFFDIVLNRGEFVAPKWRQYRAPSLRWTRFKVILGSALMVLVTSPIALWITHMVAISEAATTEHDVLPTSFFLFMFVAIGAYIGLLLWAWAMSVLNDFAVPFLALEDITIADALERVKQLILRERGQVALYAVMKVVLGFAGQMGISIVFQVVFGIISMILWLAGLAASQLLLQAGVPSNIVTGLGFAVTIPLYLAYFVYCMPMIAGIVMTFLKSYSLYFLGGRYAVIGELLERSTPPPSIPNYPPHSYLSPPPPPRS